MNKTKTVKVLLQITLEVDEEFEMSEEVAADIVEKVEYAAGGHANLGDGLSFGKMMWQIGDFLDAQVVEVSAHETYATAV